MFLAILDNAIRILRATSRTVLPVWVGALGLEMIALIVLGIFSSGTGLERSPTFTLALIVGLTVLGGFQHGLLRPLRLAIRNHVVLRPRDVIRQALGRTLPALAVMELINLATAASATLAALLGPKVTFFPEIVVFFALYPALFASAGRGDSIGDAFRTALRWERVSRYGLALFSAQAVLLGLAVWLQESIIRPGEPKSFAISLAAISMYGLYRFVQWITYAALFLTIDADES